MEKEELLKQLPSIRLKLRKLLGYKTATLRYARRGGSRGTAFSIPDGKVLKVTIDKSEAKTSSKLINKHIPHVAQIYRVFTLKSIPHVYFILQERLMPLDPDEEDVVDTMELQGTYSYTSSMERVERYFFKSVDDFRDFYEVDLRLDDEDVDALLKVTQENIDLITECSEALRGFLAMFIAQASGQDLMLILHHLDFAEKVLDSLGSLVKHRIEYDDTIGANLMETRSGELKWIDLGYEAKAPGKPSLEKLEGALDRKGLYGNYTRNRCD